MQSFLEKEKNARSHQVPQESVKVGGSLGRTASLDTSQNQDNNIKHSALHYATCSKKTLDQISMEFSGNQFAALTREETMPYLKVLEKEWSTRAVKKVKDTIRKHIMTESLPSGWDYHTDAEGRMCYVNRFTNQISYVNPHLETERYE